MKLSLSSESQTMTTLTLKGTSFEQLQTTAGLQALDQRFLIELEEQDFELHQALINYRAGQLQDQKEVSQLLLKVAPFLEFFIANLFNIQEDIKQSKQNTLSYQPLFAFKQNFVLKEARRALKKADHKINFNSLNQKIKKEISQKTLNKSGLEFTIAEWGTSLLRDPNTNQASISTLIDWCVGAMTTKEGQKTVANWVTFKLPKRLDFTKLVAAQAIPDDPFKRYEGEQFRHRDGFGLTDQRMSQAEVMSEIDYCVYCHKNQGDFCSKGFPVKKNTPELGLKTSPMGEVLTGCPLEEKISEMHVLKKDGLTLAALAMITADNPMCAATGHRICNDCMKACIYQKQEPVNIPEVETRILTDVLDLPWGVEIYQLLIRWNPLRREQYLPKPYNSLKILVMGMGPAGFTLAHHLLMEGFAVVGADGLKIEPLPKQLLEQPIKDYQSICEQLDDRLMAGFGGVAEYGITVRWDKNFLKLIYLSLARNEYFQVVGGVRFGGTLTVESAWQLGFDHVAVSVGAGLPQELPVPHSLAPGMRQANDFLMALQLTGAEKKSSMANLQIRLPAVVIGGGLTAVDTATEVQAYYLTQIEKVTARYQQLALNSSKDQVRAHFNDLDQIILDEWLEHARQLAEERTLAKREGRQPDLIKLIRLWGGVSIAYRRSMQESPAYKRNHEELSKALEEGIYYAEGMQPIAVVLDSHGQSKALRCRWRIMDENGVWMISDEEQLLPARSVLVATGARLNVAYEFEHRGTFEKAEPFRYQAFQQLNGKLQACEQSSHAKSEPVAAFTSYQKNGQRVSFLGDTHPLFHGSVVKAIASAKRIYPFIFNLLKDNIKVGSEEEHQHFKQGLLEAFQAKVVAVKTLAKTVTKLTIYAPQAAEQFQAGQFYRLQNFESQAAMIKGTQLHSEALALLGIPDASNHKQLDFIVLERGVSSRILAKMKPGEAVSLMGPTGAKTNLGNQGETVLVIGGAMAAIALLSLAKHFQEKSAKVLYLACFEQEEEVFCREQIEACTDHVEWTIGQHNVIEALTHYWIKTQTDPQAISLTEIKQGLVIGPPTLLQTVRQATQTGAVLEQAFSSDIQWQASVYGPMQCMLKGVCAQCLQWQIDPATGERKKAVYACSWQHQPLEKIDIDHLDQRLQQNHCQEVLANLWLDFLGEAAKI